MSRSIRSHPPARLGEGSGSGIWSVGSRDQGFGFRIHGSGVGAWVWGMGVEGEASGSKV